MGVTLSPAWLPAERTEPLVADVTRGDTPAQVKTCCVVNAAVALSTLVAMLLHATAISRNVPGCDKILPYQPKPEWCFNPENKVEPPGP